MATNLFDCHCRTASYIRRRSNIAKVERRANELARFALPRRILYSPKVKYSESRAQSQTLLGLCQGGTVYPSDRRNIAISQQWHRKKRTIPNRNGNALKHLPQKKSQHQQTLDRGPFLAHKTDNIHPGAGQAQNHLVRIRLQNTDHPA